MSKKVGTGKSLKQFALQTESIANSVDEYNAIMQGMSQQEMHSVFTSAEIQYIRQSKLFVKKVQDAVSGIVEHICVFEKSINVTTHNKCNRKVADVPAMMKVLQTAEAMAEALEQQGYEVYTLLTDGGQVLKVYKIEKEEETLAKLQSALELLHQLGSVSNSFFTKFNELKAKQQAKNLIQAQADALGIKVSFN